ncbi:hypothetical protein GEMRC1_011639 [Eukaryota sp. GEM-RC1]
MPLRHILTAADFSREEFIEILEIARDMKANPDKYSKSLERKTLLMLFEKPSLRTRVSFEAGMTKLGGHAIYYDIKGSPLGVKETYADFSRVVSRMCDFVMARVNKRQDVCEVAKYASIPIINALDDWAHPMQMFADFLTILEHKKTVQGLKIVFVGDIRNNVTYDMMRAALVVGSEIAVAGPKGPEFDVEEEVFAELDALVAKYGGKYTVTNDPIEAVTNADVIATDSWMSYHIPKEQAESRLEVFAPYRVNGDLMKHAKKDAIFLHCLPAQRGIEVTEEVIDGPQSVIFDEAENRMWTEMAVLYWQHQQLQL